MNAEALFVPIKGQVSVVKIDKRVGVEGVGRKSQVLEENVARK